MLFLTPFNGRTLKKVWRSSYTKYIFVCYKYAIEEHKKI